MAILDAGLELSDAQAVTASAASTNVIDLSADNSTLGRGSVPLYLQVVCNTTADSSGNTATVDIALQGSDSEGSGYANVLQSVQYAEASVTAGTILLTTPFPADFPYRYARVYYTIGTENLTAGKFDAYLTTGPNK